MPDRSPLPVPLARYDLTGRTALITGASRNLGLATAKALAAVGANVAVLGRHKDTIVAAAEEIEAAGGVAHPLVGDVTELPDHRRLVAEVVDRFGGLDILVNNAGMNSRKAAMDITEADYDYANAVNAKGPLFLSQAAFPQLAASSHPSVVNILSTGMWLSAPQLLLYRSTKLALYGITMVLAQDWAAHGIRVNAVAPGFVGQRTGGQAQDAANAEPGVPLGRRGTPEEVAAAVLYLASDASSYSTGSVVRLDGGQITA